MSRRHDPARRDAAKRIARPSASRPSAAARRSAMPPEAPLPAAPEAAATRAALALAVSLALLVALRALATFVPGMGAWGANTLRFLPPVLGWPLWALMALALVPVLARPLASTLARAGDEIADFPGRAALSAWLAGATIVLLVPDRVRFVGDFLLRQGTVEEAGRPGVLFPQALPLDVWLHVTLPTAIMETGWLNANSAARAIGAVEAGLLAALAVLLARALRLRGAAAVAVAMVAWWSGSLSMFTGYSKAFGELTLLATAVAAFGLQALRTGEPPLALGVVLALGLALHRSALGLAPAWLVAWALWIAEHRGAPAWRRPAVWIAAAIPLAALALLLPRIVGLFLRWDAVHLVPAEVRNQGGPLRAAFAGNRPADLASLLLVLAPLLPAALAALAALGRDVPRRREQLLLAALILPLVGVIPFIHPVQGLFHDWDDFASAGAALAVASAWIAGEVLRGAPRFAWLALALFLGAAVPSLQWMVLQSDLDRGLGRVEAFVTEPPQRSGTERGETWDFLGIRNFRLERWAAAARAFSHAAETAPSPRILLQWALAEQKAGDVAASQRVYRRAVEKSPDDLAAWSGLASVSSQMLDEATSREAAAQMLRIHPGDRNALDLLQSIEDYKMKKATGSAGGPR